METEKQPLETPSHRSHKMLGVEIAPFRIPIHRRLETLAVLQWSMTFLLGGFGLVFLTIYLWFTSFYWLSLLTYTWLIWDRWTPSLGGRRFEAVRRWRLWQHMSNFFPVNLHKTVELDPKQNYLVAYHPHGIMVMGAFVHFCTKATDFSKLFPGIKPTLLILKGWFYFPFLRDYIMTAGICDSSKESIDFLLSKNGTGNAVCLVVGGAREALDTVPGEHRVLLNARKGFIKKAIENGAHLVPVYSFGEADIYDSTRNVPGSRMRKLQDNIMKFTGFAPAMFHGRGIFNYTMGIVPYRRCINTVVGAPIPVAKNALPTRGEVEALHGVYVEALKTLFDENKTKYGIKEDAKLEII